MLLPSVMPCEASSASSSRARPKPVSLPPFQPATFSPNGLFASCRALQTILGHVPSYVPQSAPHPRVQQLRDPLQKRPQNPLLLPPAAVKRQVPRGLNKRSRDDFELDHDQACSDSSSDDKENSISLTSVYSTPKRQRRIPLAMPLGLSASDFYALTDPDQSLPPPTSPDLDMPISITHEEDTVLEDDEDDEDDTNSLSSWSTTDDRTLVETVLEKLRLSKHEWNDCARLLGKDQDSIGRRWKMLVGDGEVGLRRGGRGSLRRRTGLDIGSW